MVVDDNDGCDLACFRERTMSACLFSLNFKKKSHILVFQVERGIDLVYGGGSIGLMGLVSHAVHDGGRHVIG